MTNLPVLNWFKVSIAKN